MLAGLSCLVLKNGLMQGLEDMRRQYLDVDALTGQLLAAGSVHALLAAHRTGLFPESMMEDRFPSKRGRTSVPAAVIVLVL